MSSEPSRREIDHAEIVQIGEIYQVRVEYREGDERGELGVRFYRRIAGEWSPRKSGIHCSASRLPDLICALQAMQRHIEGVGDE